MNKKLSAEIVTSDFNLKSIFFMLCMVTVYIPFAQTNWYYNGTGPLNNVSSWGTNTNGTGGTLTDFTSGNRRFIIQNTSAVTLTGIWNVGNANAGNAGGDSIIIGNPTNPSPPIILTIANGAALTVNKARTIGVSIPATGNQKIVYQNSSPLSFGSIADTNIEVVFDGCTMTSSSSSRFGTIRLINNAVINMGAASLSTKNLIIDAGSTLAGPIGSSSNYIAILRGGNVQINGTFKAGRLGGLFTTNVAIPVVPASGNGTLLFQDSIVPPNLTLGSASTVDYYRGTNNQTGAQIIESLNYHNLTFSNSTTASNKTFGTGTTTVSGTFTVNMLGSINVPVNQNITLKPGAKLVINSATAFPTPTGTGRFTLQSDATGTASIAEMAVGASIVGNVVCQQYLPAGFRKFRFLSHPFDSAKSLRMLSDDINITGNTAGTSLNVGQTVGHGFTRTATNNPSAFLFNTAAANGNAISDAGWQAFTSDTSRNWLPGTGIRILVRGVRNQANTLNGLDSLPQSTTIDFTGTVNYGNFTRPLVTGGTGATAGFNLVGNPYPSPVNIGAVLNSASNIGSSIYLRNPQTGSYTTINPIPSNYIIPAYTAFFVQALATTSLNFQENNKASCTNCPTVFKLSPPNNHVEIKVFKHDEEYDNVHLNFGNYSSKYEAKTDAIKLWNSEFNLYTITDDNQKLAADYRLAKPSVIRLGLQSSRLTQKQVYTLKVAYMQLDEKSKLVLHDKLTHSYQPLEANTSYQIEIDPKEQNSVGEDRLEIIITQ